MASMVWCTPSPLRRTSLFAVRDKQAGVSWYPPSTMAGAPRQARSTPDSVKRSAVVAAAGQRQANGHRQAAVGVDDDLQVRRVPVVLPGGGHTVDGVLARPAGRRDGQQRGEVIEDAVGHRLRDPEQRRHPPQRQVRAPVRRHQHSFPPQQPRSTSPPRRRINATSLVNCDSLSPENGSIRFGSSSEITAPTARHRRARDLPDRTALIRSADVTRPPLPDKRLLPQNHCLLPLCRTTPPHALAREHTQTACGMNQHLLHGVPHGLDESRYAACLSPSPGRCCVRLEPVA